MQVRSRILTAGAAAVIALGAFIVQPVRADLFGSVVKGGLIGIAVKQFSKPINQAANKIMGDAGASPEQATKVVPIVTIGNGSYVGAVQVSGPQSALDQVKAVAQLETSIMGDKFRIKALVPINTDSPKGLSIKRVKGVGVSAIIDIRI